MIRTIRILACAALLSCIFPTSAQTPPAPVVATTEPLRILFIGNSYTYYHSMPSMVSALASASGAGRSIHVKDITLPGAKAERVLGLRATKYAISDEKWDYVVLQVMPYPWVDAPERVSAMITDMHPAIKAAGAKAVIFFTWGGKGKPEETALGASYRELASKLGALFAPVGSAWEIAQASDPKLRLYEGDGHHPSATGSVLAACVLYRTVQSDQTSCPAIQMGGVQPGEFPVLGDAATKALSR